MRISSGSKDPAQVVEGQGDESLKAEEKRSSSVATDDVAIAIDDDIVVSSQGDLNIVDLTNDKRTAAEIDTEDEIAESATENDIFHTPVNKKVRLMKGDGGTTKLYPTRAKNKHPRTPASKLKNCVGDVKQRRRPKQVVQQKNPKQQRQKLVNCDPLLIRY